MTLYIYPVSQTDGQKHGSSLHGNSSYRGNIWEALDNIFKSAHLNVLELPGFLLLIFSGFPGALVAHFALVPFFLET